MSIETFPSNENDPTKAYGINTQPENTCDKSTESPYPIEIEVDSWPGGVTVETQIDDDTWECATYLS